MVKYLDDEGLQTFKDDLDGKFASYEEVQTLISEMSGRLTNYDILCVVDDTIDTYKIRITTEYTKKQNGTLIGYTNGHFDYLTYKDCLTPADPSNLVENIVLTNEDGIEFNCVLTISSRNTDNNRDDNAPHNMFAPANKRISPNNKVLCLENSDSFTMEIDFVERVPYRYASDLRFTVFNNGGDFTVTYEVINSNNEIVYTDVTEVEGQSGKIQLTPTAEPEEEVEIDDTYEIINTVDIVERGDIFA